MSDERLLGRWLRRAAAYAEQHGDGIVRLDPSTARRFVLPVCMVAAEARAWGTQLETLETL